MIEVGELFKGIAVVIDNEIGKKDANINNLIKQIIKQNIPFITYKTLPNDEITANFQNISFVLLDWDLITDSTVADTTIEGVKIPDTLKKSGVDDNINFITTLKNSCYCPVFIFSDLDITSINNKLEEHGIYSKDKPNHIFVKSKNDLIGKTKLFKEIEKWIMQNPSTYVLKKWENEYQKSKNKMFIEFQELSSVWPKIMWKTYSDDGVNKSLELGELITRNLLTRMIPFEFSNEILSKRKKKISNNEITRVLEGERYLKNENLYQDSIAPGDVFKDSSNYYLNIRAACDLFPDRNNQNSDLDDVQLYLIKGTILSYNQTKKYFNKPYGNFSEIDNQVIIFPILSGKAIDFRFKNLKIKKWSEIKNKRIGRILPPHVTRIQQKYAQYIHRQGLPRIPAEAVQRFSEEP